MPGRIFPIPVPRERMGGPERHDPADTGPIVEGDQKYNKKDGSLLQSHNGGQYDYTDRVQPDKGMIMSDLYVWEEE